MASLAGFEPATRCLEGSRSILLSYRDGLCSHCYSIITGVSSQENMYIVFLTLPHADDSQSEVGQAGDDYPGNQHANGDAQESVPESQTENDRCQCTGPGAGYRQGDSDEKNQTNSLILLDDFSAAARTLEEPVQDALEEAHLAQQSGNIVQKEQDKGYRQQVPDYAE